MAQKYINSKLSWLIEGQTCFLFIIIYFFTYACWRWMYKWYDGKEGKVELNCMSPRNHLPPHSVISSVERETDSRGERFVSLTSHGSDSYCRGAAIEQLGSLLQTFCWRLNNRHWMVNRQGAKHIFGTQQIHSVIVTTGDGERTTESQFRKEPLMELMHGGTNKKAERRRDGPGR